MVARPPRFGAPLTHQEALKISDAWWRMIAPLKERPPR